MTYARSPLGTFRQNRKRLHEVRAIIAARPKEQRCSDECKCWLIVETDTEAGDTIQACDECNSYDRANPLSDMDVTLLPEARAALKRYPL